ncbi:MAG: CRISPR-associated helicase Cas3', partial [Candidatus Paceibacterota bacterium]
MLTYDQFFRQATKSPSEPQGRQPYPYQRTFALGDELPELLNVPTGVGKTATAVLGWLYRRRFHSKGSVRQATPRRLVYCLPMRTLVEQTYDAASTWLRNLELADVASGGVAVHLLMGGTDDGRWYEHPERDAILIGTQDMLLSRALNRGYAVSRYAWPVQYALLNNDCQWVLDETQLMGVGLTTSAQLAGLREKLQTFGNCPTMWMSATLDATALFTVDHPAPESGRWTAATLQEADRQHVSVARLLTAAKPCQQANVSLTPESKKTYAQTLAEDVLESHQAGTLTLIVVNRVSRAQEVFASLRKQLEKQDEPPEIQLIHSRFRPHDRKQTQDAALDEASIPDVGRILVATQAIEAGVDISATTLFTELAPWSSLVQRFGRCNRRGKCGLDGQPPAQVYWIDIETADPKKAVETALPYEPASLDRARECLATFADAGPQSLEAVVLEQPRPIPHVIRRKDLLDLFDTTADLSGNDLDISRYIRDGDDTDVQVYWRQWDRKDKQLNGLPPEPATSSGSVAFPAPVREELCAVSVAAVRGRTGFIEKAAKKDFRCYAWNSLDRQWQIVRPDAVRPGMTLLFHADAGGYDAALGWTGDPKHSPVTDCRPENGQLQDAMDREDLA